MTVAIIRSSVVLPAPFGPSSPNTPGPVCRLTPATAWVRPNRLVSSVISTFMMFLSGSGSRTRAIAPQPAAKAR